MFFKICVFVYKGHLLIKSALTVVSPKEGWNHLMSVHDIFGVALAQIAWNCNILYYISKTPRLVLPYQQNIFPPPFPKFMGLSLFYRLPWVILYIIIDRLDYIKLLINYGNTIYQQHRAMVQNHQFKLPVTSIQYG